MKKLLLIPLLLAVTGCEQLTGFTEAKAPLITYGLHGGAGSAGMHTVSGSERLWDIAQRYRLSMEDIITVNNLSAPYALARGQRLTLPPPRTYTVHSDDSLYDISRTFGISTTQLAYQNNLQPPYRLSAGQVLKLPSVNGVTRPAPESMVVRAQKVDAVEKMELAPPSSVAAASRSSIESAPLAPPGAVSSVPVAIPKPVAVAATSADIPARAGTTFAWPVRGKVISGYGPKAGGLHNDGINIAAARGTAVKAADNGVVVYAGNELRGFGNLVLVKHADRWVTAYAHMDNITVARGQVVKVGQSIGTVGSTGSVSSPQLHFEVRRGTAALNPAVYLAHQNI